MVTGKMKTDRFDFCILVCVLASFVAFFFFERENKKNMEFQAQYEIKTINVQNDASSESIEWLFAERLKDYKSTISALGGSLINIVGIIVLGLLVLFYRPDGIQVSFLSIQIPQSLLYLIIVAGSVYMWQNLGLQLNSAIDARMSLVNLSENIIPASLNGNLPPTQKIDHILVDNAIVDNWVGHFFDLFYVETERLSSVKAYSAIGLFFIYGNLFALLYTVCFATVVEFGIRVSDSKLLSDILLIFTLVIMLVANYVWITKHEYASEFTAYYWLMAGVLLFLWKTKGIELADKISPQKKTKLPEK